MPPAGKHHGEDYQENHNNGHDRADLYPARRARVGDS
jgi:hypothetical protein